MSVLRIIDQIEISTPMSKERLEHAVSAVTTRGENS